MSWVEDSLVPDWFEESSRCFTIIRETYKLTHVGTHEGRSKVVMWGLKHPDTAMLVYDWDRKEFFPVTAGQWDAITTWSPPFPWNAMGSAIVYPPPGHKQWWQS